MKEIDQRKGEWVFVDLGFGEKAVSCGISRGDGTSTEVKFGDLVRLVKREARRPGPSPLNLVLEAPLSVAFDKDGNPVPRRIDRRAGMQRDWYRYAGPQMILSAGYLMHALVNCGIQRHLVLFEGFVSFKTRKTKHADDAMAMKAAVWNQDRDCIIDPKKLKRRESDKLESAFKFMGMDFGIPPVIMP
ncbi:MAG: hypothetical protein OXI54_10420 [Chloroflexota bacterium]|nr:hypothetical protein [Chloroflexota bacterium]MDE2684544.1 hypothetical protein [Chloroflexota bacterium]